MCFTGTVGSRKIELFFLKFTKKHKFQNTLTKPNRTKPNQTKTRNPKMNTNEVIAIAETVAEKKTPVKKTIPKKTMGYLKFALFAIQFEDEDILKKLFLDKSIDEIVNIVNDVVEKGDQDKTINEMRKNFLTPPKAPKAKAPAKPRAKKASAADAIVADLVNLATKPVADADADPKSDADAEKPVADAEKKPQRKPRAKKTDKQANAEPDANAEANADKEKPQRKPRAKKTDKQANAESVAEEVAIEMQKIADENARVEQRVEEAKAIKAETFNYTASIGFENESAYKFINKALKIKLENNIGEHVADNYKISMDNNMALVSFRELDAKLIKATMKKIANALKVDENSWSLNDDANDCEITL